MGQMQAAMFGPLPTRIGGLHLDFCKLLAFPLRERVKKDRGQFRETRQAFFSGNGLRPTISRGEK